MIPSKIKFIALIFFVSLIQLTSEKVNAQSCVTGISYNELYFPSYADFKYVDVYRNPEWCDTWDAYTNDSWITVWKDYTYG